MTPSAAAASAISALLVDDCDRDTPRVAIPRPEIHIVVRFGPATAQGLDAHAFGVWEHARRKVIRGGQRAVTARLHLGTAAAVLGVPPSEIAGRIVALEDLWGSGKTRRLYAELAEAKSTTLAAAVLERAIALRVNEQARHATPQLAIEAAQRLSTTHVNLVADELGVSERHLRRIFRDAIGVAPKTYARLLRFHRALDFARADARVNWASIAARAGYYDQAHLIAEFRSMAGVTPRVLLGELGLAFLV